MRVTVTGGAGFIGSAVVRRAIEEDLEVCVLDDFSSGLEMNLAGVRRVRTVRGDVRDPAAVDEALAGSEGVFHLAAHVGNVRSLEDPLADCSVNAHGTLQVLEGMRRHGIRRLVYSSSSAIYGEARSVPISEDHSCEPDSPYGASKLVAEKYCLCYGRAYGWSVACPRYFNAFGVRQRFDAYGNVIPIFARRLVTGQELVVFGDGEQTRDFVDVEDIARANLAAFRAGVTGTFNVATGRGTTVNVLASVMASLWGGEPGVRHVEARPGEVRHSRAAIGKAREAFGFEPRVGLEEGLRRYLRWFREDAAHD